MKNKKRTDNSVIKKTYFNPKNIAGFSGKGKLLKVLNGKVSPKKVNQWLEGTETYTLHKPARKNFSRRKYIVGGINSLLQADLSDLPSLSKYNDGFRYVLFIIDVFSKRLFAKPLKTKSAVEVSQAVKNFLDSAQPPVISIQTDLGKEFMNSNFKSIMKEFGINHYTSKNQQIKASHVERVQRTIKDRVFRYFTHNNTQRYIDVLSDIVDSYNNTPHQSHGVSPNSVNHDNQEEIWQKMYNPDIPATSTAFKYSVGDVVRISKHSTIFKKGYLPSWTEEVFTIVKRHRTNPPVYTLQDGNDEELDGTFYEPELQRVNVKDNTFRVEAILGHRKINGRTQYLVKWFGYPDSFNSYVNKSDMIANYKN